MKHAIIRSVLKVLTGEFCRRGPPQHWPLLMGLTFAKWDSVQWAAGSSENGILWKQESADLSHKQKTEDLGIYVIGFLFVTLPRLTI